MVVVNCGTGIGRGLPFNNERYLWAIWIKENINLDIDPFAQIRPHKDGNKAIIEFENKEDETLFVLKAPKYISYKVIQEYRKLCK